MSDEADEILDFTSNGTWCIAYLRLPGEDRERGLWATALNFFSTGDGLAKGWETAFPKVVDLLTNGPTKTPVTDLKLRVVAPDDATG